MDALDYPTLLILTIIFGIVWMIHSSDKRRP